MRRGSSSWADCLRRGLDAAFAECCTVSGGSDVGAAADVDAVVAAAAAVDEFDDGCDFGEVLKQPDREQGSLSAAAAAVGGSDFQVTRCCCWVCRGRLWQRGCT